MNLFKTKPVEILATELDPRFGLPQNSLLGLILMKMDSMVEPCFSSSGYLSTKLGMFGVALHVVGGPDEQGAVFHSLSIEGNGSSRNLGIRYSVEGNVEDWRTLADRVNVDHYDPFYGVGLPFRSESLDCGSDDQMEVSREALIVVTSTFLEDLARLRN